MLSYYLNNQMEQSANSCATNEYVVNDVEYNKHPEEKSVVVALWQIPKKGVAFWELFMV